MANTDKEFRLTVGGAVQAKDGTYLRRSVDAELLEACLERDYSHVLACRQIGKTSLKDETAIQLIQHDVKVARIDLNSIGSSTSKEKWYFSLLDGIHKDLRLNGHIDLDSWWKNKDHHTTSSKFFQYFDEILLNEISKSVVIFIDEIDVTLDLPFTDDFFTTIRTIYNDRSKKQDYRRLTFVLLGVATPDELIKGFRRTPYNIGTEITISDFKFEECSDLYKAIANSHSEHESKQYFKEMYRWTKGHPYLTQLISERIALSQPDETEGAVEFVDRVVGKVFESELSLSKIGTAKNSNLQFIHKRIINDPHCSKMLRVYKKVLKGQLVSDSELTPAIRKLKLYGLLVAREGILEVRNPIYQKHFSLKWLRENKPTDYVARYAYIIITLLIVTIGLLSTALFRYPDLGLLIQKEGYEDVKNIDQLAEDLEKISSWNYLPLRYLSAYYSGVAYQLMDDLDEAETMYIRSIALNSSFARPYRGLGKVYERGDKIDKAIENYKIAIELNPNYSWAHHNLADLYRKAGEDDLSFQHYDQSLSSSTQDFLHYPFSKSWTWYKKGRMLFSDYEFDDAISELSQGLKEYPNSSDLSRIRCLSYFELDDLNKAIEDCLHSFQHLFKGESALFALNFILMDDLEHLVSIYDGLIDENPDDFRIYKHRAMAYRLDKQYLLGISDITHAIQIADSDSVVQSQLLSTRGDIYLAADMTVEAFDDFVRAKELNDGINLFREMKLYGNYGEQVALMTQIIDRFPTNEFAYYYRAFTHAENGKYEESLDDLNRAIILNPIYEDAYYLRSDAQLKLNRPMDALNSANKLIDLEKLGYRGYSLRSAVYENLSRRQTALDDISTAIELLSQREILSEVGSEKLAGFLARRAKLNIHGGSISAAIDDYAAATFILPSLEISEKLQELSLESNSRLSILSGIVEKIPDNYIVYRNRANYYVELGFYDEAIDDFTTAISLNQRAPSLYESRGDAYYEKQLLNKAYDDYVKSRQRGAFFNVYEKFRVTSNVTKTVENFTILIDANPQNSDLYIQRGSALIEKSEIEPALSDYQEAINRADQKAQYYFSRGEVFFEQEKFPEAIADYSRSINLAPEYASYYARRADVYLASSDFSQSINDYNKAIQISSSYQYYHNRAIAYAALNMIDKAVGDFESTISIYPSVEIGEKFFKSVPPEVQLAVLTRLAEKKLDSPQVFLALVTVNLKEQKYMEAVGALTQAIALTPPNYYSRAELFVERGRLHKKLNLFQDAYEDFSAAKSLSYPVSVSAEFDNNDTNRNIEIYSQLISKNGQDADLFRHRSRLYEEAGEIDLAIQDISSVIELQPENPDGYKNRGDISVRREEYNEAIADYSKAIELDEGNANSYRRRADAHGRLGDLRSAIQDVTQAIALQPEDMGHYEHRSRLYEEAGEIDLAIQDISSVIELQPENPDGYKNRGDISVRREEYNEAIADYSKAIELDEGNANSYRRRADAHGRLGDLRSAIQDVTQAIALQPEDMGHYEHRSRLYEEAGEIDLAIQDISSVIELQPENPDGYKNRGDISVRREEYNEAIADYSKAIELDEGNANSYRRRADAHGRLGDLRSAIQDVTQAIALQPEDMGHYEHRSRLYEEAGEIDLAVQDISSVIELQPENPDGYKNRGNIHLRREEYNEAIADYSKAIELDEGNANSYRQRADAHGRLGDLRSAIQDVTQAIALQPEDMGHYEHRSRLYEEAGEIDLAVQDISSVIELQPENPDGYKNRGNIHLRREEYNEAIADYSKAIELDEGNANSYRQRADAHGRLGDLRSAIQDVTQAITLQPEDGGHYEHRANLYKGLDEYNQALADYSSAVERGFTSSLKLRAEVYVLIGELLTAHDDFASYLDIAPAEALDIDYVKSQIQLLEERINPSQPASPLALPSTIFDSPLLTPADP